MNLLLVIPSSYLPEGHDDDPPDALTVRGLGNRKNETFTRRVREDGVAAYPGSVRYLKAVRDAGLRRAVVSSSANCHDVLVGAGIEDLLEVRIDGVVAKPVLDLRLEPGHDRGSHRHHVHRGWEAMFERYRKEFGELAGEIERTQRRDLPDGWEKALPTFPPDPKGIATPDSSGQVPR